MATLPPSTVVPVVRSGAVVSYRMFDIGDDIAFARAVALLREARHTDVTIAPRPTGTMDVSAVPLRVDLGQRSLSLPRQGAIAASCSIRLFPTGIASVCYTFPIAPGTSLDALIPLCQELYVADSLVDAARAEVDAIVAVVRDAISGYHVWDEFEDHHRLLRELEDGLSGADLLRWSGLRALCSGSRPTFPSPTSSARTSSSTPTPTCRRTWWWSTEQRGGPRSRGRRRAGRRPEFANSLLLNLRYYDDLSTWSSGASTRSRAPGGAAPSSTRTRSSPTR